MAVRDKDHRRTPHKSEKASERHGQADAHQTTIEELQVALQRAEDLKTIYEAGLSAGIISPEAVHTVEDAQRLFDEKIATARLRQLAWMEHLGPPEGWVRVDELAAQGWIRTEDGPVDISSLRDNTDHMADITDYSKELQLRDDQLRRDMAAQRELADERMKGFDERMRAFMDNQIERDKRIEDIAARATKAAESAATVKSNYWAAVGVQLLAVAAILVGAYFATQANTLSAIATTLSAYQAGKTESAPVPPTQASPSASAPPPKNDKQ